MGVQRVVPKLSGDIRTCAGLLSTQDAMNVEENDGVEGIPRWPDPGDEPCDAHHIARLSRSRPSALRVADQCQQLRKSLRYCKALMA